MALTFLQLAEKVLQEEQRPLTATEIWHAAVRKNYQTAVNTEGKTPWASLGALIYVDVRDNPSTKFFPLGARPKRFILKTQKTLLGGVIPDTNNIDSLKIPKFEFLEKDLHPLMVFSAFTT